MIEKTIHILLIEDNPGDARLIREMFRETPFMLTHVGNLKKGIAALVNTNFDTVVLDLDLPDSLGINTFNTVYAQSPETPIIVLTGNLDERIGLRAVQSGAQDFMIKGQVNANLLGRTVKYAIERKHTQQQILYQATLIDNISDAIIATDMDYRITSWNEAAEKTYGWKPDEVLGELLSEKLTPEYPAASRDQVTQSFLVDGAWQGEVIHHHKNGTPLHIFGSVSMLKDNYNNPIGAVSVNRDITEQKKIAQKLAQSEKRYRTLAEAAQDFIFIINPDMRVEYLNDFGAAVFRRNPKEIIGTPLAELFPHTAPELGESLQLVFQTGEPLYQENPIEFPDRVLWLGTRLAPITNASGETTAVLGLARDITETKAVEAALLKSEALYQDLYNNAPDMYVSVEAASGIILQCNRTLEIATGYTQDEIVGHPIFKLYHPDSLPGAQNAFQTFAATGEIHDAELQLRRKDGSEIDVSLNVSAVRDAAGNILSSRSSWRDITERKQMELALQEYSERLEDMVAERTRDLETAQDQLVRQEKLTVLGKLAGGLAHELRTPLNTIKNVAHFLGMALENPDAEVSQSLKILDNAADNADRVITSLLSFARPQIPSRQIVNLPEFINTLLARFNIPKNITLQMELSAAPQEISADPNHLEIVLNNLIRNALQAMPDGGNLEIWATLQTEPESRQDWISVAVRDSGAGISDENMARLFEPLFSTKVKGFGLGLVISEMLVKGHGGRIEVESLPGQGSSFTMLLPVDPLPFF